MLRKTLNLLILLPALAACASKSEIATPASAPAVRPDPVPVRPPVRRSAPPLQLQTLPGTESVIGASRAELLRQFGPARLDVWEGDARKLQFAGQACVLDVYLYPKNSGAEPQAAYVDARRPSDGRDVDRAACITALRRP